MSPEHALQTTRLINSTFDISSVMMLALLPLFILLVHAEHVTNIVKGSFIEQQIKFSVIL